MKENIQDIGRLFRQGFEGFEKKPPEDLWDKIQLALPNSRPSFFRRHGWKLAGGSFVAALVTIWLLLPTETKVIKTEMPAIVKTESIQTSNTPIIKDETKKPLPIQSTVAIIKSDKNEGNTQNTSDKNQVVVAIDIPQSHVSAPEIHPISKTGVRAATQLNSSIQEIPQIEQKSNVAASIKPSIAIIEDDNNPSVTVEETEIHSVCKGEEVMLSASGGMYYRWSNGQSNESIVVIPENSLTVSVEITKRDGTISTKLFQVKVLDCSMYIPRAFSPNDDGNNDQFKVRAEGITSFEMKIFSKWGEMVFESKDSETGWEGRIRSRKAPMGIYIYQIRFTDIQNNPRAIFGTFTLLP